MAEIIYHKYVQCPECKEHEFKVDHIYNDGKKYKWTCNECKSSISICIKDDHAEVKCIEKKHKSGLSLLRYQNIAIIVDSFLVDGDLDKEYFFNEHTCPTNYLQDVLAIIDLETQDADPHGIFEHVKTIYKSDDIDYDLFMFEEWKELFEGEGNGNKLLLDKRD